jgi:cysteine-rich secretory family protein
MRHFRLLALALALAGCTGTFGDVDGDEDGATGAGANGSSQNAATGSGLSGPGSGGESSASAGGGPVGSGGAGASSPSDMMCARWNADRQDLDEGNWSGSIGSCNPGDVSAPGRDNALKLVNLYRFLAGLPAVTHDGTRNTKAQACALMMHANGQLSHNPPTSWTCYSADGAEAAGKSNIASTPGVIGVDLYMADPGNESTIGHRRWILSRSLGPIGLGSTSSFSCMWVIGGSGASAVDWVAFPSPGPFPVEAMTVSFASVDDTGWTLQSDTIDLSGAQVTITDGGQNLGVAVTTLAGGYGSTHAIKMTPQGWNSQAGHTYDVSVTGISQAISYSVEMVACE